MDEYISREALLAEIAADHGNWIFDNDTDELYRQGVEDNYSDTKCGAEVKDGDAE